MRHPRISSREAIHVAVAAFCSGGFVGFYVARATGLPARFDLALAVAALAALLAAGRRGA